MTAKNSSVVSGLKTTSSHRTLFSAPRIASGLVTHTAAIGRGARPDCSGPRAAPRVSCDGPAGGFSAVYPPPGPGPPPPLPQASPAPLHPPDAHVLVVVVQTPVSHADDVSTCASGGCNAAGDACTPRRWRARTRRRVNAREAFREAGA